MDGARESLRAKDRAVLQLGIYRCDVSYRRLGASPTKSVVVTVLPPPPPLRLLPCLLANSRRSASSVVRTHRTATAAAERFIVDPVTQQAIPGIVFALRLRSATSAFDTARGKD